MTSSGNALALEYRQPGFILRRFQDALEMLKLEVPRFDVRTGERALAFRLGLYLQTVFPDQIVDSEYDRNLEDKKRILQLFDIRLTPSENQAIEYRLPGVPRTPPTPPARRSPRGDIIYPDLIVHRRHHNDGNILVIEVKKPGGTPSAIHKDIQKLKGFTQSDYGYALGIFLELSLVEPYWLAFTGGELNLQLSHWPLPDA